jgi:hypothetical protein
MKKNGESEILRCSFCNGVFRSGGLSSAAEGGSLPSEALEDGRAVARTPS